MSRDPTPEQSTIIEAATTSQDNLIINALAGAGKTTTIEMLCNRLQGIPILYLAFNRRIVDEAVKRMPSHVECRTQNSLGHRVWGQATGRRLAVDGQKMRNIFKNIVADLRGPEREMAWDEYADTMRWFSRAKRDGYVPPAWADRGRPLIQWADFIDQYDDPPSALQSRIIEAGLTASIMAAYEGGIDYDDQLYMPVIFGGPWPRFPLVMIDEAQDLSPLNHEMLKKLVTRRLIAVGDPWQSIYAFRGAVSNGMRALRDHFSMRELPLSVTFRVPREGVRRAQRRVPHFRWAEGAPEGEVIHLQEWSADDVPEGAAIICRNNAPLLSLGFKLLRSGRHIRLVGMDIGAGLVRILKRLGPGPMSDAIETWAQAQLRAGRKPESVADRAECLLALCEGRSDLADAIRNAEYIFKREGPIQLLSGHKAKGLEWPVVFHLDPWRIPSRFAKEGTEEWEQEMNVQYVVETRFKERLVLVDLEGFQQSN